MRRTRGLLLHQRLLGYDKSVNYSIDVVFELCNEFVRVITVMRVLDTLRGIAPKIIRVRKAPPESKGKKRGRR